jgi:hypothetical protein
VERYAVLGWNSQYPEHGLTRQGRQWSGRLTGQE